MEPEAGVIEYFVSINGIDIVAHYHNIEIETVFLPFLKKLTDLQQKKKRRILVMLAAPPGSGKTTLCNYLEKLSKEIQGLEPVQIIGMDGFHRRQEYLKSHFVKRNGKMVPMVSIKGAPITFDLERLTASIRQIASGENCAWPIYDRMLHNPVENALVVNGKIVLLEGNYLLLDDYGWRDLSKYADYTVSIVADESFLRKRLIDRRIKTGVDEGSSIEFVDYSDMPNVRLCLEKSKPADYQLRINASDGYLVKIRE